MNSSPPSAIDWVHPLLGLPWVSGARGPFSFDCWGLLQHVYRERLNIELPTYPGLVATDVRATARVARDLLDNGPWRKIDRPVHLCAVGISASKAVHHVGVWLDVDGGLVLHTMDKGSTVAQSIQSLRGLGLNNLTFYAHDISKGH